MTSGNSPKDKPKSKRAREEQVIDECLGVLRAVARSEDKENVVQKVQNVDSVSTFWQFCSFIATANDAMVSILCYDASVQLIVKV